MALTGTSLSLHYKLRFVDWGLIDYRQALNQQMELVEEVARGRAPQTVVFCSHPPVVTLGRGTRPEDVFGWQGDIIEVSRGGRATYHGPSQVVAYPIVNLVNPMRAQLKSRDLHGYLRALENVIVEAVAGEGIEAVGSAKRVQVGSAHPTEATGVWVGEKKIASIGIGVRRWVTYHGFAVNVADDPEAFQGLNPCGFTSSTMVSMEKLVGRAVDRSAFQARLREQLEELLSASN